MSKVERFWLSERKSLIGILTGLRESHRFQLAASILGHNRPIPNMGHCQPARSRHSQQQGGAQFTDRKIEQPGFLFKMGSRRI